MKQITTNHPIEERLPPRLMEALQSLAKKYRNQGVEVFIFGSFARSEDRQTSDLDLGVQWKDKRSTKIFLELCRDVHNLPTIRKIDVVDMEQVDETFKRIATQESVML